MIKIDYYKFDVYEPYRFCGECHKTLRETKQAYIKHLQQGHRVGCVISGCTLKDDSIFLTFTPASSSGLVMTFTLSKSTVKSVFSLTNFCKSGLYLFKSICFGKTNKNAKYKTNKTDNVKIPVILKKFFMNSP